MDPDVVLSLATFVLLDVPDGRRFQLDMMALLCGPKFMGVKLVPAGFHLISFRVEGAAPGDEQSTWIEPVFVSGNEVIVFRWRGDKEGLLRVRDEDEVERFALAVRRFELDRRLGPYPVGLWKRWQRLTALITPEVVSKCLSSEGWSAPADVRSIASAAQASAADAAAAADASVSLTAAELTQLVLDRTWSIEQLAKTRYRGSVRAVLGEQALAFCFFVFGEHEAAMEAWKRLTAALCLCERLCTAQPDLYVLFVDTLRAQLKHCPADMLGPRSAEPSFLQRSLMDLTELLSLALPGTALHAAARKLLRSVRARFGWDVAQAALDEDGPAVVELDSAA